MEDVKDYLLLHRGHANNVNEKDCTCFALLHTLEKYIEGSGIKTVTIEEEIYSPATIRQILAGKN